LARAERDAERPSRILIVDDHEDNIEVLRARLQALGYETASARDGHEAIAAVQQHPPDLILLDVMMPGLDGNEVARRIKADPELRRIPIIMQTALESVESKVAGLDAGADDFVTKPINFTELTARVKAMLRLGSMQRELTRANADLAKLNAELEKANADLAQANAELNRVAVTDGLTGLYNRRHIEDRLQEMFEHSRRLHEPLACVMFDLDQFKSVNDTYGHQVGDKVLREFADVIRGVAREVDRIGRFGGEEFLVLLPGTVLDAAVTFAERARQQVEAIEFEHEGGTLRRTLSAGVAAWPHPRIKDRSQLVKAADDALYAAKALGRNRVVRFDSREFNEYVGEGDEQLANSNSGGIRPGA
jgi:two-component system, cell cycle response regulator